MIPYLIMMVFAGFPMFYLELALGQYSQVTPYMLYRRMCPMFNGIGLTMILISFFTGIYYNISLSWALRYLYASIIENVPWTRCRPLNDSGTKQCYDDKVAKDCVNMTTWYYDGECMTENTLQHVFKHNETAIAEIKQYYSEGLSDNNSDLISAAEAYKDYVLGYNRNADIFTNMGAPKWDLVVALFVAWVLVFFVLIKGVKSSGKVVYFTATFPYVLLLALLVIGNMQPHSGDGIEFYLKPKWEELKNFRIWADAAGQIFFSLSVAGGGLTTLATYNKFNNNLLRDTMIVVIGNCATSIFAGFVIFPILGFIAFNTGRTVKAVAQSGPTLAFVSYPDALTRVSGPHQLYAALFFFMLILLGIDSQLVIVEVVVTMLRDRFTWFEKTFLRRMSVVLGVCTVCFLFGLIMTTPEGPAIYNLVDTYAGSYTLVVSGLFELVMVSYFYGFNRFVADIRVMLGRPPNRFWKLLGYPTNIYWHACWAVITPVLLTAIMGFQFANSGGFRYDDKSYPDWGVGLGWCLFTLCIIWIPFFAILYTCKSVIRNYGYRWLILPTADWGPSDKRAKKLIAENHPYYEKTENKSSTAPPLMNTVSVAGLGDIYEGHPATKPNTHYPDNTQVVHPVSYKMTTDHF